MNTDIITRHYIHPDIEFYVARGDTELELKRHDDFVNTIVRWKTILHEGYGLGSGSTLGIFNQVLGFEYICLVVAAAELGIRLVLTPEKPTAITGESAKLDALISVYGMIDLCILDDVCMRAKPVLAAAKLYGRKIEHFDIINTYQIKDPVVEATMRDTINAQPDNELTLTTTSGSTGEPKLIVYNHRQMYRIGRRNIQAYGYDQVTTCHTRNMHHAFVLLCHFLPTITGTRVHYAKNFDDAEESEILNFYEFICRHKISSVVVSYKTMLDGLFDAMIRRGLRFEHKIEFVVGGYYITEDYVAKIRAVNLDRIVSTFGSNETLAPILLRYVNQDTPTEDYKPNFLGTPCDDYYQLSIDSDQQLVVQCPELFDQPIAMPDKFEGNPEQGYHHQGRDNFYRIDHHDISLQKVQSIVYKYVDGEYSITVDIPYQRLYLVLWYGTVDLAGLNTEMRDRVGIPFADCEMLSTAEFNNEFKLNHDKIRNHFRSKGK